MAVALALAAAILLLALVTTLSQVRGLKRLARRAHVTSVERAFLSGRYRRRLFTAGVLAAVGLLIGGAYLSGLEHDADRLLPGDAARPEMTPEQKVLLRTWVLYWTGVVVLGAALLGLAFADALATRRYWLVLYKELREDHQLRLRRDLAVHKQQVNERLNGRLRPRGSAGG